MNKCTYIYRSILISSELSKPKVNSKSTNSDGGTTNSDGCTDICLKYKKKFTILNVTSVLHIVKKPIDRLVGTGKSKRVVDFIFI